MNIAETDKYLSKLTTKEIRLVASSNKKRVADFSDSDKWTCWTDIMNCKFGRRAVQEYLDGLKK